MHNLLRAVARTCPYGPGWRAYATNPNRIARPPKLIPPPAARPSLHGIVIKTPKEYLDTLRRIATAARDPDDVQYAIRFLARRTPRDGSQLDGWNALLRALAARNDPKLLSALFFADPFRSWMATDELGARACAAVLRAKFAHFDPKAIGTLNDARRMVKQLLVRGGKPTPELRDVVLDGCRQHSMDISDELYVALGMEPPEHPPVQESTHDATSVAADLEELDASACDVLPASDGPSLEVQAPLEDGSAGHASQERGSRDMQDAPAESGDPPPERDDRQKPTVAPTSLWSFL